MPQTERKDICFESADGRTGVRGYFYTCPEVAPTCVLQLSHGMCEYIGRYADFAAYLAENGVAVCGNDHIGHGESVCSTDDYGYFGENGHQHVLADLHTMNHLIHEEFPGLPVVLLGHSMGSFYARAYAAQWPDTIQGLIISGTGGPNPAVGVGLALTSLIGKTRGHRHRSKLIHNIAFGAYLKRIPAPKTPYDWISRDEALVQAYAADPKCTFRFTANGFHELFSILKSVSGPEWAQRLPKQIPTLLIAGEADPVGEYGKGVDKVHGWLQTAGMERLEYKLYPGMRHEVLNEVGRQEVYADVLAFTKAACQ